MPRFRKDGLSWEHVVLLALCLLAGWFGGDKLVFLSFFSLSNYPNALGFG